MDHPTNRKWLAMITPICTLRSFGSRGPTVPKPILRGRFNDLSMLKKPILPSPPKTEKDGLEPMIFLVRRNIFSGEPAVSLPELSWK